MPRLLKTLPALFLAAALTTLGCHAQQPPASTKVSPELARRIEILLRTKAQLPPGSSVLVGPRSPGPFPGYDTVSVSFTNIDGQTSHPVDFLLSTDGKTLAQFSKFDISADPKSIISGEGRPWRGGPANAPVTIVAFDDLECPYCARLHANIFPAITDRYKDQVRVVYRDFPLEQHPWAMRAAIDTSCLAAQSVPGYWNVVDYIHAHAGEIGASPASKDGKAPEDKTINRANDQLDTIVRQQGTFQKVDTARLDACMTKQDTTATEDSKKLAQKLGVDSTPSLFINGDKIDGAVPIEFLFKIIDQALVAEGKTPPPPFVPPTPPAPPAPTPTTKPAPPK